MPLDMSEPAVKLRRYGFLTSFTLRNDEEQAEVEALRDYFLARGEDPGWPILPRQTTPAHEGWPEGKEPKIVHVMWTGASVKNTRLCKTKNFSEPVCHIKDARKWLQMFAVGELKPTLRFCRACLDVMPDKPKGWEKFTT